MENGRNMRCVLSVIRVDMLYVIRQRNSISDYFLL